LKIKRKPCRIVDRGSWIVEERSVEEEEEERGARRVVCDELFSLVMNFLVL